MMPRRILLLLLAEGLLDSAHALVSIETTRERFSQSFSSPSGKLTHAPELVLPEPKDATAILLQTNAIQQLSTRIRSCKANAAFVRADSLSALRTFCQEQESARGQFPGPVPVVYCGGCDFGARDKADDADDKGRAIGRMEAVAEAGADGVLVPVLDGKEIKTNSDLAMAAIDSSFMSTCEAARKFGLQPVPEIVVGESEAREWSEEDVRAMVDTVVEAMGGESPVCVLLTVNPARTELSDEGGGPAAGQEPEPLALPSIPKSLIKRVPIVGSVRAQAGDGRIGQEAAHMKQAGFSSVLLRHDCLPGYRSQLDLDIVGHFWSSCIDDLKSVKSKSFSFRAKNNMEKNQGTVWANYQNNVIESGALGDMNDSYSILDSEAGEYKGFA